jgi:hypothetical protein
MALPGESIPLNLEKSDSRFEWLAVGTLACRIQYHLTIPPDSMPFERG